MEVYRLKFDRQWYGFYIEDFMGKFLIINTNNFGLSKEANSAILEGYNNGFLQSASICTNGEAFPAAVNDIIPECSQLDLGITLNITNGKPLTKCPKLTNNKGYFNKTFLYFALKSSDINLLEEIEKEFRAQIERGINIGKISHLRTLNEVHSIPNIFNIVIKLANEYNIGYLQTHNENLYAIQGNKQYFNPKLYSNAIKVLLMNIFTKKNIKTLNEYKNIKTNTHLMGVLYRGFLDTKSVETALKNIEDNTITEITISPVLNKKQKRNYLNIITDKNLEYSIGSLGFEITNTKNL